jgi:glucokinase
MKILSGDIGGTNCRLAIYDTQGDAVNCLIDETWPSAGADHLNEIVRRFLEQHGIAPDAAGFGLAGPVTGRVCQTTNLPWLVDADQMEQQLKLPRVELLNDLEATAWGIGALQEKDLLTLQAGAPNASGNRLVVAAGTGLGQAGLYWDGELHRPYATEGGHCDFAPASPEEFELLGFLEQEFGHVSWERLVSGPGLHNIYRFLLSSRSDAKAIAGLDDDPGAAIARGAEQGDPLCQYAMELFFHLFAREAANAALKAMARGGVYLGGGIAPKNLEWLKRPAFLDTFRAKGRMTPLMEAMPLHVILNDRIALMGPVRYLLTERAA